MKVQNLYIECSSGISGDMTVGALLDLGVEEQGLLDALHSLPLTEYEIVISDVMKSGVHAKDFDVQLRTQNFDHDMQYLYGRHEKQEVEHVHEHDHGQAHEHTHEHHQVQEAGHTHVHRGLKEIEDIIDAGALTDNTKKLAKKIFHILAEAEGKVHERPMEEVHFHEVGAVDSIVDIVAIAYCMDALGFMEAYVPTIYEGHGTVRCQHGVLPVPVPAVLAIAEKYEISMSFLPLEGEFVTPTGAAFVAAVSNQKPLPKGLQIKKVGVGAGKREYDGPGVVRAMIIVEETP